MILPFEEQARAFIDFNNLWTDSNTRHKKYI